MANTSIPDIYGTGPQGVSHPAYNPAIALVDGDLITLRQSGQTKDSAGLLTLLIDWVRKKAFIKPVRVVTAAGAITVTTADYYIGVNKTTGAATVVNLPATPAIGLQFIIKDEKLDAATNNITITPAAGNIIGSTNAATYVLNTAGQSATVIYNGTAWTVC